MPNASGRYPTSMALTRVTELMKSEGIMERVKSKREFIRPGLKASLGRMKRRQDRFNVMVSKTISEILDMKDRLK